MAGGEEGARGNYQRGNETEIESKEITLDEKVFSLMVKENDRGIFMKFSEVGKGSRGRLSRLLMSMITASHLRDHLLEMTDFIATLEEPNPENLPEGGRLKSLSISARNKRYYVDLRENERGRFLRISEILLRGGPRSQLAIPLEGITEVQQALAELVEKYASSDQGPRSPREKQTEGSNDRQASRGGYQRGSEKEIDSKEVTMDTKQFSLMVRENERGLFMKISEVGGRGRFNRLLMSLGVASQFRDQISDMCDYLSALDEQVEVPEDGKLKTSVVTGRNKRYYLDLRENDRGRFLRVSQTIPGGGPRSQIAIPAEGLVDIETAMSELLEKYGSTEDMEVMPESKAMKAANKIYYFDVDKNNRGMYLRISEVRDFYRSSVTFPYKAWQGLCDVIDLYIQETEGHAESKPDNPETGEGVQGAGDV